MSTSTDKLPCFSQYDGDFVTSELAVGGRPTVEDVPDLINAGFKSVINVVAICGRADIAYVHHLPQDVFWLHLAFWDGVLRGGSVREHLTEGYARHIILRAAVCMRDHSPVLIHCMGGKGRSANLAAILLAAKMNISPQEAIEEIRRYRPKVSHFHVESFWRGMVPDELVDLARQVFSESHTDLQMIGDRVRQGRSVVVSSDGGANVGRYDCQMPTR